MSIVLALVVSMLGVVAITRQAFAFSEPDANATLTVVKVLDNQEDTNGNSGLGLCQFQLQILRFDGSTVHEFPAAEPDVCADPQATTGTTSVGVNVDFTKSSQSDIFFVTEDTVTDDYVATYSGDCDPAGRVVVGVGDNKTCLVRNTFLNQASMAGSNALLTVIKQVDNGGESDPTMLDACDFTISLTSLSSGAVEAEFPAESGFACDQPELLIGTTQLGIAVDGAAHDPFAPDRFVIREPVLDPRYVATFSGDCPGGEVIIRRGEHQTCVVTNTLVDVNTDPDANALLTVVKLLDNQEDQTGLDGQNLCAFELAVHRVDGTFEELASFAAATPDVCQSDPDATIGTTNLGVKVTNNGHGLPESTFRVSEPSLGASYLALFSGDCDTSGQVVLEQGEHKTCYVRNTLLNEASMANANALLTVIKQVDNLGAVGGTLLDACDFESEVIDPENGNQLAAFFGEQGSVCSGSNVLTGTTQLGIDVDSVLKDPSAPSRFVLQEPSLDARYVATFSGDCPDGVVEISRAEHLTCVITNTLIEAPVNNAPVANYDGYATDEDTPLIVAAAGGVLANDTDTDGDPLSAVLVSGPANGALALAADGSFSYTPNPDFNGADSFAYRATDGSLDSNIAAVTISVSAVNDAPVISANLILVPVDEGQTAVNGGAVSDVDGDAVTLSSSTGSVVNNGDGSWSWSFTTTDGPTDSQPVTISADDGQGGTSAVTFDLVVGNVAPTVAAGAGQSANEGDTVALNPATFSDPGTLDTHLATIDWGDGTPLETGVVTQGAGSGSVSGAHVYADNGLYTVTVCVTDDDGGVGCDTLLVTVHNVAPTVEPITAPVDPVQIGSTVNASAPFTDPGTLDSHTATIAWGDGTTSVGAVTEASGSGSVSGSHAYTTPGVYTVVLTVTDNNGGSSESIYQYIVVFDPNGGFVTGGGWIDSPAGAYPADPTLTGKASFGFVAKYKKGQTTPDGNTQFQFQAGGLSFHSSSYEWLVIAGARAQFKGAGTINGGGEYGFLLTAIDGQVSGGGGTDRFRIKIWDMATGAVVYDNQLTADDDAPLTTTLGGGSIVIHKQ